MLDVLLPPEVIEICRADLNATGKVILLILALYKLKLFPPWLVSNYDVSNWACKCTAYSISCDFTFT